MTDCLRRAFAIFGGAILVLGSMQSNSEEELETLWELTNTRSTIFVRVTSNGCTDERSFRVDVIPTREDPHLRTIKFVRVRADDCKMRVPEGKLLKFMKTSLGLQPFTLLLVLNPFGLPPYAQTREREK
jgi:hypothetical protein